jgi:hypothetical protein
MAKVDLLVRLIKHNATKMHEGAEVHVQIFSVLDGGKESASHPGSFAPNG